MAETYYFSNTKTKVSPYLSDTDIIEPIHHPYIQLEDYTPPIYDEETHALLHIDPYIDLIMQSQPLTYAFTSSSPLFNTPDRFVHPKPTEYGSRMDGFGIIQHRFDGNGHLLETRSDSPVDYASKSLAKQLRQLHLGGNRVLTPELPERQISTTFDAPWWTTDSIYENDEQVGVLPVYRSSVTLITNIPNTKQGMDILLTPTDFISPNLESTNINSRCEASTQYESALVPRILIDAVTGTDEMEVDLRNAAVSDFVDNMIESMTHTNISKVNESTDPNVKMISCAVDSSTSDVLKSPEREYEFVNAAEIVE